MVLRIRAPRSLKGIACLKTFLLSYSLIFWLTGIILVAVGVLCKMKLQAYLPLPAQAISAAPWVMIVTGVFVLLFGMFGCFAIWKGEAWMLKAYAATAMLVFLLEMAAGIAGFVFKDQIQGTIGDIYEIAVKNYDGEDAKSKVIDHIQTTLTCCGVNSFRDWERADHFNSSGVPASCCSGNDCDIIKRKDIEQAGEIVYNTGCFEKITDFMKSNLALVGGIAIGFAFFHLLGIGMACYFSRFGAAIQQP